MERRWLLFFLLSFVVIQIFTIYMERNKPRPTRRELAQETSATLVADGLTTGPRVSVEVLAEGTETSDTQAQRLALAQAREARSVAGTSLTIASHPGRITTATTEKYAIGIDEVGAVVNSWLLLDPGSQSFVRRFGVEEGIEMVRRIPRPVGSDEPLPQNWPLQISFQERGAYSYEDFNDIVWEVRTPATDGEKREVLLQFVSPPIRGIRVVKTFLIPRNEYFSTLRVTLRNETDTTVPVTDDNGRGLLVRWGPGLVERSLEADHALAPYDRAVYRTEKGIFSAHPVADKEPIEGEGRIEWAGVESKFFAALLVPEQPDDAARKRIYYFRSLVPAAHNPRIKGFSPPLTMELASQRFDLPPRSEVTLDYGVYVGPKKYSVLKKYGHHLQALMFHDSWPFMRAIYLFLTDLLNWIYRFVHNYGVAIIILTIIVRLAVFPLTQHSIRIQAKTMAEQAKIKPYLDEINEKYKNDPQEKNRQIWKVYQEHGISPFGALRGCVPMLLQLPVFYGLYRVSNDTIDLQGAHFLWIRDLSQPDQLFSFGMALPLIGTHFNLLPILMGLTQMLATKVSMARVKVMDPTQKQMMYMMPIIMIVVLYHMPAGLMVYWNASNIWQIFQTILTNRQMAREEAKHAALAGNPPVPPPPPPRTKSKRK
ncbi:MAG: hypothetical protein KatS3mg130_0202 [Candidatus Sumerlaea sp.]|nr:MAG: hypothetical protein KatS3mg130_0202 [Candidatus Sumerlaea sp.]